MASILTQNDSQQQLPQADPVVTSRERVLLLVWLIGAVSMSVVLLRDLFWAVFRG